MQSLQSDRDGVGTQGGGQSGQVSNPGQGGGGSERSTTNPGQGGGGGAGRTSDTGSGGQQSEKTSGGQERSGS